MTPLHLLAQSLHDAGWQIETTPAGFTFAGVEFEGARARRIEERHATSWIPGTPLEAVEVLSRLPGAHPGLAHASLALHVASGWSPPPRCAPHTCDELERAVNRIPGLAAVVSDGCVWVCDAADLTYRSVGFRPIPGSWAARLAPAIACGPCVAELANDLLQSADGLDVFVLESLARGLPWRD